MKSKFLLLLCFYCINAAAQSSDEFCKSVKIIADIAAQNELATLKQDKFKSFFLIQQLRTVLPKKYRQQ